MSKEKSLTKIYQHLTQFVFYGINCVLKNIINLSYYKEGVLCFQNIYKLSDFFSFGSQKFGKQHISNIEYIHKTKIYLLFSRLHLFLFYPQKYIFYRNIMYFYVLDFENNFEMSLKQSCIIDSFEQKHM